MFLFDTDIITHALKKRPSETLLRKFSGLDPSVQFISTITIAEIVYGAEKSPHRELHLRHLQEVLLPAVNILDFDSRAAYLAGRLRAELERKGISVSFPDLQIASIALANELTLVTGNVRHFERIPTLRIENWMK